ncbi:hypothetical protein CYMTET_34203 [Cymbomonas tetramitiformis]|uniref:Selenoprotein F/M domain-containing protein n=1 Tax=Cymbomonas tetramitiformis TaxID=36881 RepID=A0AAE0KQ65_9CHLO|nr:hypothetical protein CYMTET_34203 [Cymbomonas tetramitiformis]
MSGRIQSEVEAKKFEDTTVKYIPGRKPELVVFDDNEKETSRDNVERLSYREIEALLISKGFKKKGGSEL